jgi:hypothetical protein
MQKTAASTRKPAQGILLIRKFVVAIGIGLVLASIRFDIWKLRQGLGQNYWSDWTTRVLLIGLVAVCAVLLIANVWREERERFMASISGVGAILLGFFLFPPVADGFGNLLFGPKLALAGSALIVLGALPVPALRSWQRSRKRPALSLHLAWLLAAIGPALAVVALGRDAASAPIVSPNSVGLAGPRPTYWRSVGFSNGHALGILMLAIAVVVIVLALGDVILKAPVLGRWALAASLLLLGVTLWYPTSLSDLSTIGTGAGLALEGSVLAVAVAIAAVAVERGALAPKALDLRRLLAIGGIGLALAGLWTNVWGEAGSSFWTDGTTGGLGLLLVAAAIILVGLSLVVRRKRLAAGAVSAIGWVLAGLFGYWIALLAPQWQGQQGLSALGPATWLGLAGGALMGVSVVFPRIPAIWRSRSLVLARLSKLTPGRVAVSLITGIGSAVALGSLWLDAEPTESTKALFGAVFGQNLPKGTKNEIFHTSYWSAPVPIRTGVVGTDHSLGIVMLVLGAMVLVALVAMLVTRLPAMRSWMLAASLALLGLALHNPAFEAFTHLGSLRSGAWLALAGSFLAAAGAVGLCLIDLPSEEAVEEETTKAKRAPRAPRRGGQRRVPETRRA